MTISEFGIFIIISFLCGYITRYIFDLYFNSETTSNFWYLQKKIFSHTIETESVIPNLSSISKDIQKEDDLKLIEGIGPKTEVLLKSHGISTFKELANTEEDDLRTMLDTEGDRFALVNTRTWTTQAMLARDGKLDELKTYQEKLFRGME